MRKLLRFAMVVALSAVAFAQEHQHNMPAAASPYVGEEGRQLKALSAEQVQSLLNGEGMGFAKPAELNHYPGPKHVLDAAAELKLTTEQQSRMKQIYEHIHGDAVRLGREYLDAETHIEHLFASGSADAATLQPAIEHAARLQGQIRLAHLAAHLETRQVLTAEQLAIYDRVRGYSGQGDAHHNH